MTGQVKIYKSLLPFSFLYGIGVWFRNKLFDWKILPTEEFSIPIICVGNITVGGTGKTPHTEFLIRLLSRNAKVAVLSRGYKRKSSGFVLADENATSLTIGDEPYQMYRKFPGILVAVDKNRRRGIRQLLDLPEDKRPEIILLDDAFQHRYVTPSLSILLTDSKRLIYEDVLLPAGRLREHKDNKSRAGMVIVTKCPDEFKPIDYRVILKHLKLYPYQSLFFTSFKYGNLTSVFHPGNNNQIPLQEIKEKNMSVLLVAGIANPQDLIEEVENYSGNLQTMIFPDHHNFSKKDLAKITAAFDKMPGENKMIITTEKDAVRLIRFQPDDHIKNAMHYLPIEVHFKLEQENSFKQKIEEHVRNIKRNRSMA